MLDNSENTLFSFGNVPRAFLCIGNILNGKMSQAPRYMATSTHVVIFGSHFLPSVRLPSHVRAFGETVKARADDNTKKWR